MKCLYICTQGARVGIEGHRVMVKMDNDTIAEVPIEPLEMIELYGNVQMTTQAVRECMERRIPVGLYSVGGFYIGKVNAADDVGRADIVKAQIYRSGDPDYRIKLAHSIICAKIHNQKVLLRKYSYGEPQNIREKIRELDILQKRVNRSTTISEVMGIEGMAARTYFSVLGQLLEGPFTFERRSRRPATDPYNALINFGYAVLQNQVEGKLTLRGLHPAIGLIHSTHGNKKALSYDLMEEWRPVLVDSLALHCLRTHELKEDHFTIEEGAIRLTREGMRIYRKKIEDRYEMKTSYIDGKEMKFRKAIKYQTDQLARAIMQNDPKMYRPCRIR